MYKPLSPYRRPVSQHTYDYLSSHGAYRSLAGTKLYCSVTEAEVRIRLTIEVMQPPPIAVSASVCLSVYLSACSLVCLKKHVQIPVAVAPSSYDNAICYVLPVCG